jgi:uncharacterized protein (UPF0335 family)
MAAAPGRGAPSRRAQARRARWRAMPTADIARRLDACGRAAHHSALPRPVSGFAMSDVDAGHLRAFIERIEKLEEEKKAIADDIKDVYGEAKANGFDVKIMRKVVSIRKQDRDKRIEEETILDLYLAALGMQG